MNLIAEGIDINELACYDGVFDDGESGAVGIDLDRMLTPSEIQSLQEDMVRRGTIITGIDQDDTGKLTIYFENNTPSGVGVIGVLTIVTIAVGTFLLAGVGIFGWQLWSALSKTPWYVWWIFAAAVVGGLLYLLTKTSK